MSMFNFGTILTTLAFGFAITIFRASHPLTSLLSLIGTFLVMFIVMLSIKVEFLAYLFLIIYVGAIAILFLFVIMMFNLKELASNAIPTSREKLAFLTLSILIVLKVIYLLKSKLQVFFLEHTIL
jgi:NADH:ubiquinone oxidoreductase subunit 6 (subunit J)